MVRIRKAVKIFLSLDGEKFLSFFLSIEIVLFRKETIQCSEDTFVSTTPILVLQLATGSVQNGIQIPFYMIFPHQFVIRTIIQKHFKIEFLVAFSVKFQNKKEFESEKVPIITYR